MKRMKRILVCWLLLASLCSALAEGCWTLNEDRYYHVDPGCDGGEKMAISEEAAVVFGKTACPICVKGLEPVYTGETLPTWTEECGMWEISWTLDPERRVALKTELPEEYREAAYAVSSAFEERHAEIYDREKDAYVLIETYPEYYGGMYLNCSGTMTFLMVDPTEEKMRDFAQRYGTGVWIVPVKYSYAELRAAQIRLWDEITEWIAQSGMNVQLNMMGVNELENVLEIGLYGADWQTAAEMMNLPVYARTIETAPFSTDTGFDAAPFVTDPNY